jgi:hypothetical protein
MMHFFLAFLKLALSCSLLWLFCCASLAAPPCSQLTLTTRPWVAADRLFRQDRRWLGGDGAASVPLPSGDVLWLFGDSFVEPNGSGQRDRAILVANTMAIQHGRNPAVATMAFFWRLHKGLPAPYFPAAPGRRLWPTSAVAVGHKVLVALVESCCHDAALSFRITGSKLVLLEPTGADPLSWRVRQLVIRQQRSGILLGVAALHVGGHGTLHALSPEDQPPHAVHVARLEQAAILAGKPIVPAWMRSPEGHGEAILRQGQVELGLGRMASCWLVAMNGNVLGWQPLALGASHILGPWHKLAWQGLAITPPQGLLYALKVHPELQGAPLVFTYTSNSLDEKRLLADQAYYYPRFLRAKVGPGLTQAQAWKAGQVPQLP